MMYRSTSKQIRIQWNMILRKQDLPQLYRFQQISTSTSQRSLAQLTMSAVALLFAVVEESVCPEQLASTVRNQYKTSVNTRLSVCRDAASKTTVETFTIAHNLVSLIRIAKIVKAQQRRTANPHQVAARLATVVPRTYATRVLRVLVMFAIKTPNASLAYAPLNNPRAYR